jgi:hypothetical protein
VTTLPQHSDELEKLLIITFANMMIGKDYPSVDQLVASTMPLFTAELKKREAAALHKAKTDEVDITVIRYRWSKLKAGLFAVDPLLKKPYPDDERWTPWTRFIGPQASQLERAINPDRQVTLRSEAEQ